MEESGFSEFMDNSELTEDVRGLLSIALKTSMKILDLESSMLKAFGSRGVLILFLLYLKSLGALPVTHIPGIGESREFIL